MLLEDLVWIGAGTALEVGLLLSLTRLASLRLVDMKVGDRDCAGIAALTQLTELDLRATSVSDTGVQGLSRLLRLHRLDVTWTQATAPPALSSLTSLHMENCRVRAPCFCMPSALSTSLLKMTGL